MIEESRVYEQRAGDDVEEEEKMPPMGKKTEQKGKLVMDPMVENLWGSKEYSTPAEESVLLVGKFAGRPGITPGGFVSQTAGVGQMKLEAPPRYSGKRHSGVRVWLTQIERYM